MGEPAELSEADRGRVIKQAKKIYDQVDWDGSILDAIHDYKVGPQGEKRDAFEAAEMRHVDSAKLGDLEADVEMTLLEQAQVILRLVDSNKMMLAVVRMDEAERDRFRAWCVKGRDKVVELALEIGRHWRDQEGVNGALLEQLAEATMDK